MNPTEIETISLNVPCPKCYIVAGGPKKHFETFPIFAAYSENIS